MSDLLTMITSPAWAYLALLGLLAVDTFVPVVPIQAVMITAGALTVYGDLSLPLTLATGALGMFAGDFCAYLLGRSSGRSSGDGRLAALRRRCVERTGSTTRPSRRRLARRAAIRFTRGLRRPGPVVLMLCRFVPGGRMAACYRAGRVRYPYRLFLAFGGGAAACWASYAGLVGHLGGLALTQSAWRLFAVAATAAIVFGTAGWVVALAGGRPRPADGTDPATGTDPVTDGDPDADPEPGTHPDDRRPTEARAASADERPRRSSRTATGRS